MIQYHKGDLFSTPDKIIGHGVNCLGVMGSGVALIVKNKYPLAFKQYLGGSLTLGFVQAVDNPDGKVIVNMHTQYSCGNDPSKRYVSYDAIADCFVAMNDLLYYREEVSFSIPKIGAGLGNGKWPIIEKIIENSIEPRYNVNVYTLE